MWRRAVSIWAALVLSAATVVTAGCLNRLAQAIKKRNQNASPASSPVIVGNRTQTGTASDSDEATTKKLNLYIQKCLNSFSSSVLRSRERYAQWVDMQKGPTGRERYVYGLYEISSQPAECSQAVEQANALEPQLPEIEKAARDYAAALNEAATVINMAYPYYERENYKDDQMAHGKELHPQLVRAFEEFEKADKELSARVDVLQEEVSQRRLAELKSDPDRRLEYLIRNSQAIAKRVVHASTEGPMEKISITEYQPLVESYEQAVDEMERYAAGHQEEARRYMMFSMYLSQSKNLVIAAKELMRRVRDREPFKGMERSWVGTSSGWMVNGSPDKVLYQYNQLISSYNSLR